MEILQLLVYGIVIGSVISLGAIGVSLTFGILGFANFAHGDLMTVGAYIAFTVFALASLPLAVALPAAIIGTAIVAVLVDRTVFRRFRTSRPIILLIASFGVALVLRSLVQLVWGPDTYLFQKGIQLPWQVMGLRVKPDHLTIFACAVALVIALHLLLQRTRIGKAMRAVADNPDLAKVSGIDTERVILWTWVIGASLAAAAGTFLAMDTRIQPDMGWHILLPLFAAAIVGGIGKPYGAIVGGLVIGIAQEMSTLVLPPAYKPAVAFAFIVVMLIWRPTGLFAGRST